MYKRAIFLFTLIILTVGCASSPAYKDMFRADSNFNSKEFAVSKDILYDATVRTLCSKNFIIEKEDKENGFILGKWSSQKGKRTTILLLQAKISVKPEDKSMIYLNALQTTERSFVADRTRFFLFVVPLPGGGGKEGSTIKEGEKVIEDKEFYQNFLSAIGKEIKGS